MTLPVEVTLPALKTEIRCEEPIDQWIGQGVHIAQGRCHTDEQVTLDEIERIHDGKKKVRRPTGGEG